MTQNDWNAKKMSFEWKRFLNARGIATTTEKRREQEQNFGLYLSRMSQVSHFFEEGNAAENTTNPTSAGGGAA